MSRGWRCEVPGALRTCRHAVPEWRGLLRFQRSHIDGEAILHIGLEHSFVGFVNLLDGDNLDIRGDVVRAAEVKHLLRLGNAADGRAGEAAASNQQAESKTKRSSTTMLSEYPP